MVTSDRCEVDCMGSNPVTLRFTQRRFCRDFDVVEPTGGRATRAARAEGSSEHNHHQALIAPPRRRQAIGRHQARRQKLPHSFVACGSDDEILKSNVLSSSCLYQGCLHEFTVIKNSPLLTTAGLSMSWVMPRRRHNRLLTRRQTTDRTRMKDGSAEIRGRFYPRVTSIDDHLDSGKRHFNHGSH